MQHEDSCRPQCLFGDILERAPQHALEILQRRQQECLGVLEVEGSKKRKMSPSKGLQKRIRDMGREFISDAVQLLRQSLPTKKQVRAHCYVHGSSCRLRVHPHPPGDGSRMSTSISVTGFSCVDWSAMGKRLGWLGGSSLVWAQWCAELLAREEDWAVCECTDGFDAEHFQSIISDVYELRCIFVSPQTLGEPASRMRVYMILVNKARWQFSEQVQQASAQEVFDSIFAQRVVLPVPAKFRAVDSDVQLFMQELLAKQRKPTSSASGQAWSYVQACSAASRASVLEHKEWLEANAEPPYTNWVANLQQRANYMPPTPCIPALLTGSQLYVFGIERIALGSEHFEVQGWNLYGRSDVGPCEKLRLALRNLPKTHQHSLSGNCMHLHVIGAVLLFVLSHIRSAADITDSQVEI